MAGHCFNVCKCEEKSYPALWLDDYQNEGVLLDEKKGAICAILR